MSSAAKYLALNGSGVLCCVLDAALSAFRSNRIGLRSHMKASDMILVLQHVCRERRISLSTTQEEGCQLSQLDPDFAEKYKCRKKLCPVEDQDGKQYYHVFDFTDLKDMQESSRIFYQPKERAVSDTAIYIRGYVFRIVLEFPYKVNRHEKHFR